jgi:serine/threonine protein kinase/Tol biopolymer transport system component
MGEVYRARDTRLERTVAVKVLPSHLSASPDVRLRFEREAKTISSLSHPHICALYDVGNQDGVEFLVMEYLEGTTLSDKLAMGPLPFDQVLRCGGEIADALDKAHRQGIVHRDLKPGNVMLTKSGVKLLDFGLAKMVAPSAARSGASLTALPTEARGSNLTEEGTILGTFQYMAPEQLEGRDADARTDIFAFGAVLYEMATGRKAFSGRSQASLISSIMGSEPPAVSTVAPMAPVAFDRVVRTCLAKDPDDRWQTAHDIGVQLKWIQEGSSAAAAPLSPAPPRKRTAAILPWLVAALATAGMIVLAVRDRLRPVPQPPAVVRFGILPPEKTTFTPPGEHAASQFAVSPDGRSVAFVASLPGSRSLLWVRPFDSLVATSIPGTEEAIHPFWSPDGRSIGFFTPTALKRVELSGGIPQKLCDTAGGRGGSWNGAGIILFADSAATPIFQVPDTGGEPEPVTRLDASRGDISHRYPSFLPDGRHFFYFLRGSKRELQGIYVSSLDSPQSRLVLKSDSLGVYASPGYLLTVRQARLVAYPFDEKTLQAGPRPLSVAESVPAGAPPGYAPFAISPNGVLAYSSTFIRGRELVWFDRSGKKLATIGEPGDYSTPDLSPDEKRFAVSMRETTQANTDIWIFDSARGAWSRFTFDAANDRAPLWSPDGSRIVFGSAARGLLDLWEKPSSGTGEPRLRVATAEEKFPTDWSRDGRFVVYHTFRGKGAWDIWVAPMDGEKPFLFLDSRFTEVQGRISPDGRWMAFSSDESGRYEIYVTDFPEKRGRWQLSTNGGLQPSWRADGKEVFYVTPDQALMSVAVRGGETFEAAPPVALFKANFPPWVPAYWRYYCPSQDGQRFLVTALVPEASASPINVVLNWTAGLKK